MRSRPALAAACAAGLTLLAGCGVSQAPAATVTSPPPRPTSATSATGGASPTTSAPTLAATAPPAVSTPVPTPPPDMARDDEAGAIAAAEYFVTDLFQYTYASQDTGPFKAVSHADCIFCSSTVARVESEREGARRTQPGLMTIESAVAAVMSEGAYEVKFDIDREADVLWSSDGHVLGTDEPAHVEAAVYVLWDAGHWILRGVDALTPDGGPS